MLIWSRSVAPVALVVTMDGLHTKAPVLPEGRPGGVTLTGAVLAGEGHGLRALAHSDMTIWKYFNIKHQF